MEKKVGDLKVNNGGGLLDNDGMIDQIIITCNDAVKELTNGQYINFCTKISNVGQMLIVLKRGIKEYHEAMQKKVDELKRIANDSNEGAD